MLESKYIQGVIAKAQLLNKTVVLPEGEDHRILEAAHYCADNQIAKLIILGNVEAIKAEFAAKGWSLDNIELVDPAKSPRLQEYTDLLYNLRKEKGLTAEEAAKLVLVPNYFGTLMIKSGHADAMVSGANHSTADTVRPALQIIKSSCKDRGVSSVFVEVCNGKPYYLADCAINMYPEPKELADIALQTAMTALQFGDQPKVAMLSYSTYGSGKGDSVDKVREATKLAKAMLDTTEFSGCGIELDGEIQADAALDMTVGNKKAPGSNVAGQANVLIFPNIDAGNIACKLLQRLGGAEAYGPMLQGLNAPVNDLSRGALVEDIIGLIAMTVLQSHK